MRKLGWLALALIFAPVALRASDKPYAWPALPDKSEIQRVMGLKSETGLIILERHCDIDINTFEGVQREEFVRFLVINESGVRASSIEVKDPRAGHVETIEARVVAPDGTITPADPEKDIHTIEVTRFKRNVTLAGVATVRFPAASVGAVLDLHFATKFKGPTFFYADPVTFGENPALKTEFDIKVERGFPGTQWSATLLGGRAGTGTLEKKSGQSMQAHFGPLVPGKEEPLTVPFQQRDTALLLYLKWEFYDQKGPTEKIGYHFDVDPRGRPANFTWDGAPMKGWWQKHFKDQQESADKFMKDAGKAQDLSADAIAPDSLPLEERIQKLYRYTQEHVAYAPDAKDVTTLADVMRDGEKSPWQGTLLFAYLLGRARIPHTVALVCNRRTFRFSPIIANTYAYEMADAVFVEVPGKGRIFYMPGDLSMPCGCLAEEYQDSMAFWTLPGDSIGCGLTPLNPSGADRIEYRYKGALAADGSLSGTISLTKWGAAADEFKDWYRLREYRKSHPKPEEKGKELSEDEKQAQLDKRLREEVKLPGTQLDLKEFTLVSPGASSTEPLTIACAFTMKSAAQKAQGDTWLVRGFPLLAGYATPFTSASRQTPIWYPEGGRVVMDGIVTLPPGAKTLELPGLYQFSGPDLTTLASAVEVGEQGGAPSIKAHLEYDRPLVVGTDKYAAWRTYDETLASRGDIRCTATWPFSKELE